MNQRRLGHRPALDGLRGLAMLAVVWTHAQPGAFRTGGAVGVEVFFVLSGFLITSLLIEEHHLSATVDLRAFWHRRMARLLPPMAALLAFSAALYAITTDRQILIGIIANIGYVSNVAVTQTSIGPLDHTWSLAVEAHFYLLWPPLLLAVASRRRGVPSIAMILVVASTGWRMWLQVDGEGWFRLAAGTDTRIAGIALGCAAAWAWRRREIIVPQFLVFPSLAVLVWSATITGTGWLSMLPVVDVAAVMLVLHCASPQPLRTLQSRLLVRAGRLSYAAYLYHYPLIWLLREGAHLTLSRTVLVLTLTWLAAEASMRWLEAPLRKRLRHADQESVSASDVAGDRDGVR